MKDNRLCLASPTQINNLFSIMKHTSALYLCLLFASVFLSSCSNDSSSNTKLVKRIVDVSSDGTLKTNLFTYDGTKIVSIDQDDNSLVFTYSGNLITKIIETNLTAQTQVTLDYTYSNNNLTKIVSSENYAMYFTHNTDGTIYYEKKNIDANNNEVLEFHGVMYFENENLIKDEKIFDNTDVNILRKNTLDNYYDSNTNPLFAILGFKKLLNFNEVISKNNANNSTNSYYEYYLDTNQSISSIQQVILGIQYNSDNSPKERVSEKPVIVIGTINSNYSKSLFEY